MAIIVKSLSWEHYPRGNLESLNSAGTGGTFVNFIHGYIHAHTHMYTCNDAYIPLIASPQCWSLRIRNDNLMSFCWMVIRFACIEQRCASSKQHTRYASAASWSANNAWDSNLMGLMSVMSSLSHISRITRWKLSFGIRSSVVF